MDSQPINRADFFRRLGGLSVVVFLDRLPVPAATEPLKHPEPRAGITSSKVLKAEEIGERARKSVREAYDTARQYPVIFDGLSCACGCEGDKSHQHRSLLACYETRQPMGCHGCQEEARFIAPLAKEGKALAEIRTAVDKKFG